MFNLLIFIVSWRQNLSKIIPLDLTDVITQNSALMCLFTTCPVDPPVTFIHLSAILPTGPLTLLSHRGVIGAVRINLKVHNKQVLHGNTFWQFRKSPGRWFTWLLGEVNSDLSFCATTDAAGITSAPFLANHEILNTVKASTLVNSRGCLSGKLGPHSRYPKQIIFIRFPNPCRWFVKLWMIMKLSC